MKVLHVPFTYFHDPIGGTEVYVDALARQQTQDGLEAVVAAPGERHERYEHNGLTVWRFPVSDRVNNLRELYGEGDQLAADTFAGILDEERPDVVHLHALTRGASLRLVHEAKSRSIPVIFSYHTPTVSCQRGTLLRWGTEICDGTLNRQACSECTLHGLGLDVSLSAIAGRIPSSVGRIAGAAGLSGGLWTAMRTSELVELRHDTFRSLMHEVDHVVAMSDWVKALLCRNDVPPAKITVSRQGLLVPRPRAEQGLDGHARRAKALRVMFLGRLDPSKGAHLLVEALRMSPDLPVALDVYGTGREPSAKTYLAMLKALADDDCRIAFPGAIASGDVIERMRAYDVVAVPSQVLETGPLVVLEAFAAGVPVIGSNLGGIAELVTDSVNGLLVEAQTTAAWQLMLERVATDRTLVAALAARVPEPRGIDVVADEISTVYSRVHRGGSSSRFPRRDLTSDAAVLVASSLQ